MSWIYGMSETKLLDDLRKHGNGPRSTLKQIPRPHAPTGQKLTHLSYSSIDCSSRNNVFRECNVRFKKE